MTKVLTDDGISISYSTLGTGPRDLFFLHGWAGSSGFWDEMFKHLDLTGLRAVAVDLRGHGKSDKPAAGYTHERFARDIVAVADHVNAERFVIVGYSMSGRFAQYLTCIAPERVLGQILIAGCPASEVQVPPDTYKFLISCAGNREMMGQMEAMFIKRPVAVEVMNRFLDNAVKVPLVALDETLKMCMNSSFAEKLKAVRRPTLVVGGIHDPMFTPELLREEVVAHVSGARLALVDCGHDIPIEKPQETAALLEAFLAGLG